MTELQSKLQELRELVEAKTVECPRCHGLGAPPELDRDIQPSPCDDCDGTGRIPDPAYVPLLEVVRVKLNPLEWVVQGDIENKRYITRSWDELPKGALAGALTVATLPLDSLQLVFLGLGWLTENLDLVVCKRLIEALKEEAK